MNYKPILAALFLLPAALAAETVEANWQKHCAKCHGPDGKGETKMGRKAGVKDMTAAQYQAELTDAKAIAAIKEGIKEGNTQKMKPVAGLSDDEIKALVAHVRALAK